MVTILEPFCQHNPRPLLEGNPLGFAFQESEVLQILLKVTEAKHSESGSFFSHWKYFQFLTGYRVLKLWLVHNGAKSQPWTNPLSHLRTLLPIYFVFLFFSNLCQGSFPKKKVWRLQKDTWKLNYIMGLMKCKILHFACKTIQYFLSWKNLQTATGREDYYKKYNNHDNTILYNYIHSLRSIAWSFCQIPVSLCIMFLDAHR